MPRFDFKRLAARAAGKPAELRISILRGNNSNPISLPGSRGRDGLVSVITVDSGGSAFKADITSTASLVAGAAGHDGSIVPGANVGSDDLEVTWYKFSRP